MFGNVFKKIPGFRTGKRYKMFIAIIIYLIAIGLLLSASGATIGDKLLQMLELFLCLSIPFILITNIGNIRNKLPVFNKKLIRFNILGGFIVLVILSTSISIMNNLKSPEQKHLDILSQQQSDKVAANEAAAKVAKSEKAASDAKAVTAAKVITDAKSVAAAKVAADAKAITDAKTAAAAKVVADAKAVTDARIAADAKAVAAKAASAKAASVATAAASAKYSEWVTAQFSVWDGSQTYLVDLVKQNLNDDKSFKHVKTTYVDKGTYLIVKMTYRAANAFGGIILQNITAKSDYKTNTISIISQND